jgi:tetratricopeptide (TPR) repeat protein
VLLAQERRLEATAVLETCSAVGAAGAEELNLLADLYAEQKLVPEAISAYRLLASSGADRGQKRLLNLAQMLIASNDLGAAAQVLEGLRDSVSEAHRVEYLQTRADLLAARKLWSEARTEIERLLTFAPLNGRALLSLGQSYLGEDNYVKARFAFEAALRDQSATYRASLALANIDVHDKHYPDAVQHLEKALTIEKSPAVQDFLARVRPLAEKRNASNL